MFWVFFDLIDREVWIRRVYLYVQGQENGGENGITTFLLQKWKVDKFILFPFDEDATLLVTYSKR